MKIYIVGAVCLAIGGIGGAIATETLMTKRLKKFVPLLSNALVDVFYGVEDMTPEEIRTKLEEEMKFIAIAMR